VGFSVPKQPVISCDTFGITVRRTPPAGDRDMQDSDRVASGYCLPVRPGNEPFASPVCVDWSVADESARAAVPLVEIRLQDVTPRARFERELNGFLNVPSPAAVRFEWRSATSVTVRCSTLWDVVAIASMSWRVLRRLGVDGILFRNAPGVDTLRRPSRAATAPAVPRYAVRASDRNLDAEADQLRIGGDARWIQPVSTARRRRGALGSRGPSAMRRGSDDGDQEARDSWIALSGLLVVAAVAGLWIVGRFRRCRLARHHPSVRPT